METKQKEWNYKLVCSNCKWATLIQEFVTLNKKECVNCGRKFVNDYQLYYPTLNRVV